MRNTKSAFTLVELIVVITILAILGTIAFISLQGYSQEARNSKVTSDIRNLVTAVETDSARNGTDLSTLVTGDLSGTNGVTGNIGSGTTIDTSNYAVGNLDLATLGQGSEDFTDPNGNDAAYIYSYASTDGFSGYQLAGEIVEDGTVMARIQGNYYDASEDDSDVDGLISAATGTDPLVNNAVISGSGTTDASLYQ